MKKLIYILLLMPMFAIGQIVPFGFMETSGTSGSANVLIAAGSDDAREIISTGFNETTTDRIIFGTDTNNYAAGVRFTGVNIPAGATITSAKIQFVSRFTRTGTITATIKAQKGSDPLTFANSPVAQRVQGSGRTFTTATQSWSPGDWSASEDGADTLTDDFSAVLQEVVDDGAYASTHAIVVVITAVGATNSRQFQAYENSTSDCAELIVEWTN